METVSLQRAFRAGSEDEGLLPRLQSLGEHGPRPGLAVLRDRRRRATDTRGDPSAEPWADPELTDVESLTIEIFGETLGLNSDASIWRYACDHLRDWFPGLGTEWNFVRRCANLCWLNVQDAPAGLVSRPRDRVELRQALRQPVLAERSGRPVPSLRGLERLRRSHHTCSIDFPSPSSRIQGGHDVRGRRRGFAGALVGRTGSGVSAGHRRRISCQLAGGVDDARAERRSRER